MDKAIPYFHAGFAFDPGAFSEWTERTCLRAQLFVPTGHCASKLFHLFIFTKFEPDDFQRILQYIRTHRAQVGHDITQKRRAPV